MVSIGDLEKLGQGHKILSTLYFVIQYIIRFGQNPSFHSRDNVQESYFGQNLTFESAAVTLKLR